VALAEHGFRPMALLFTQSGRRALNSRPEAEVKFAAAIIRHPNEELIDCAAFCDLREERRAMPSEVLRTIAAKLSAVLAANFPLVLVGQAKPAFHPWSLSVQFVRASGWSYQSSSLVAPVDVPSATGLDLRLSYAPVRVLAIYVAESVLDERAGDGGLAGMSELGLQIRGFVAVRSSPGATLMLDADGGIGRISSDAVPSYTFGTLGSGVALFASPRVAFRYGVEACVPLGSGQLGGAAPAATGISTYARQFFGLTFHLGAPRRT
jgi:hypothetical protein